MFLPPLLLFVVILPSCSAELPAVGISELCRAAAPRHLSLAPEQDQYDPTLPPPHSDDAADLFRGAFDLSEADFARAFGDGGGAFDRGRIFVNVRNFLQEVTEVDDIEQTVQIPVFSEKSWFDSRLRLSPEVASIDVPEEFFSRCIWSPNFIYTFLAEAKVWRTLKNPFSFRLTHEPGFDGTGGKVVVTVVTYLVVTFSCIMDFDIYPFDKQICYGLETTISSTMFPANITWSDAFSAKQSGVGYSSSSSNNNNNSSSSSANSTSTSSSDDGLVRMLQFYGQVGHDPNSQREIQYEVRVENIDQYQFNNGFALGMRMSYSGWRVLLRRKLHLHVSEVYFPTAIYVALSWLSFLVAPEVVPGRMALLVTLLLVLVNVFNRVSAIVPANSKFTALGLWLIMCIMAVVCALAEYGAILFLLRRADQLEERRRRRGGKRTREEKESGVVGSKSEEGRRRAGTAEAARLRRKASSVDSFSLAIFPVLAALCWLAYWGYYISMRSAPFSEQSDMIHDIFTGGGKFAEALKKQGF